MQRGVFRDVIVWGIVEKLLQLDGLRVLIASVVILAVVEGSGKRGETAALWRKLGDVDG